MGRKRSTISIRNDNRYQVQLDGDPVENRGRQGSVKNWRPSLNETERALIKTRQIAAKAMILFVENHKTIPEIATELGLDCKALATIAISPEYASFRAALMKRAGEMYLDLDRPHQKREIANALGMTVYQLICLTKTDEFREIYRQLFSDITTYPTIQAVESGLVEDLLPQAYVTLRSALQGSGSTALKAALEVMKLAGVQPVTPRANDKAEAIRFLKERGAVTIQNANIVVLPDGYKKALEAVGIKVEVPSEPSGIPDKYCDRGDIQGQPQDGPTDLAVLDSVANQVSV